MQRREHVDAGGRRVIEEPGRRFIVRENGRAFIQHDENERFRRWGAPRIEQRGHEHYSYIARPGGYHIVSVTDRDGRLLRRLRRGPDGREVVLIDNHARHRPGVGVVLRAHAPGEVWQSVSEVGGLAGVIGDVVQLRLPIPRRRTPPPPASLWLGLERAYDARVDEDALRRALRSRGAAAIEFTTGAATIHTARP